MDTEEIMDSIEFSDQMLTFAQKNWIDIKFISAKKNIGVHEMFEEIYEDKDIFHH